GVCRALADGINCWIDEADRRLAISLRLLIDQGGKSSPQRRCAAGSSHGPGTAIVISNPNVVRRQRDVGYISHRGRALVGDHADTLLPGGNSIGGANPATGAARAAAGVVPV